MSNKRVVKQLVTKDFYDIMVKWWEGHAFNIVSPSVLPEYTFVIYDGDIPLYCVCFYHTDSNLAWIGWEISNPDASPELKEGAMVELFNSVERYAKSHNYQIMFTTSHTKPVEQSLKKAGYTIGDTGVNHYIKPIL